MNKIEIIIKDKPASESLKTAAFPRRRPQRLGRRRLGNIYINYYDRGALADGSDVGFSITPSVVSLFRDLSSSAFTSLPYHLVQTVSSSIMAVNFSGYPPRFNFDGIDFKSELNTHLFSTDPETWATTYRKIDDTLEPDYDSSFTGETEGYFSRGWKVHPDEKNGEITTASSLYFMTSGTGATSPEWPGYESLDIATSCKVTTEQDYNADAVDFVLDANSDVFLTPSIMFYVGCAFRDGTGLDEEVWVLNALYRPLPRATIGSSEWAEILAGGAFNTGMTTGTRNWWYNLAVSDPNARCLYVDFNTATNIGGQEYDTADISSISPSSFPQNSDAHYGNVIESSRRPYIAAMLFRSPIGCCIAQIKKRGTWYYVWNTNELELDASTLHWGGFV
jgi:hypothetical protein